ncbi:polyphosphate polymerase domain-containing protein [Herbivorax sp. ANBcel31]|uniref:polyphosphate polymerase domain-containing protein n=1 Tax=Herbivorax sp. ANBcel31 TaxID=3069754 RepID=UPI0027AE79B2|nr:polyphosphate polymerase domain-containing protein [Herbivorax sp. ANBcel31]MDQ2086816.1 polyphosphate polymerase domain-containing protein [Herbivorax sp. ANBcel31]
MAIEVFNRYEKKFLVSAQVYEEVQCELRKYMELDEYNKLHPYYTISNIYYDTMNNELIRKSISKPKYKEKLRLRGYGIPSLEDKVYLEIKKKVNGLVNKRRTKLVLKEAYSYLYTSRKPEYKEYMNKQVLNEIDYFLKMYNLVPKIYIAYDRRAFFGKNNRDLRLTFDTNIRTRRTDLRLEFGDYGQRLLDDSVYLMEVKAEKSVPLWLSKMLSDFKLYKTSFSKYGVEYKKMKSENVIEGESIECLKQFLIPQLHQQSQTYPLLVR